MSLVCRKGRKIRIKLKENKNGVNYNRMIE